MAIASSRDPLDKMFHAFANESRLRLLIALCGGPQRAGDCAKQLSVSNDSARRHLRTLRDAGLVRSKIERQRRVYELVPPTNPVHARLFGCVMTCFRDVPASKKGLRKAKVSELLNACC